MSNQKTPPATKKPYYHDYCLGANALWQLKRVNDVINTNFLVKLKLNIDINEFPHSKQRKNKPRYTQYYDQQTIDMVAERYQKDIKKWRYTFDEKRS